MERIRLALVDRHRLFRDVLSRWIEDTAGDVEVVASVGSVAELRSAPGWGADVVMVEPAHTARMRDDLAELVDSGSRVVVLTEEADPVTVRTAENVGVSVCLTKAVLGAELLDVLRARPAASAS